MFKYFRISLIIITALSMACAGNSIKPSPSGNNQIIAANEAAAILQIRTLASAEATYTATTGTGGYGTLKQLVDSQAIDTGIGSGQKEGYKFEVKIPSPTSYEISAIPIQYSFTGQKSFYMNSIDGIIHASDKRGAEAVSADAPL